VIRIGCLCALPDSTKFNLRRVTRKGADVNVLSYSWRQRPNVLLRIVGIGSAQHDLGRLIKDKFMRVSLFEKVEPTLEPSIAKAPA